MKHLITKVLLIAAMSLLLFSCKLKKEKENFNYTTTYEEKESPKIEMVTEPVEVGGEIATTEDGIVYSFWFVVWMDKNSSNDMKVNSIIAQEHPGFSMKEFKEFAGENSFLLNLVEVSYETYLEYCK